MAVGGRRISRSPGHLEQTRAQTACNPAGPVQPWQTLLLSPSDLELWKLVAAHATEHSHPCLFLRPSRDPGRALLPPFEVGCRSALNPLSGDLNPALSKEGNGKAFPRSGALSTGPGSRSAYLDTTGEATHSPFWPRSPGAPTASAFWPPYGFPQAWEVGAADMCTGTRSGLLGPVAHILRPAGRPGVG